MSHKDRTDRKLVLKNSSISVSEETRYCPPDENGNAEKPFSYIRLQDRFTQNIITLYKEEVEELMSVFATWLNSNKETEKENENERLRKEV